MKEEEIIIRSVVDFLNPDICRIISDPYGDIHAAVAIRMIIFLVVMDMESANIRILTKFLDYKTYSYNLADPHSIKKARMKIVELVG